METILMLVRIILLYLIIILGSSFISYKSNKKIENCIAPFMAIVILTLYIFGIFEALKIGVLSICILSIILGIYALIKIKNSIKEKILTPGFIFFSIAFLVLLIASYNKCLTDYDHFSYRSLNTKIMFYNDTISRGFDSLYTPSSNILEYFSMKVIGVYIQGIEALTLQLFGFALLLPLFDRQKNTKFMNFIISLIIIFMPAIFANLVFYEAAYPDCYLGLIIGYVVYMFCTEKDNRFKVFTISLLLAVVVITKPIGLYIDAIILFMYLLVYLLNNKENKNNKQNAKEKIEKFFKSEEFKNIIIMIIIIVTVFTSWKIFSKINAKYNNDRIRDASYNLNGNNIGYLLKTALTTTFGYYDGNDHDAADSNGDLIPKLYAFYTVMGPVRMTLIGAIAGLFIAMVFIYKAQINESDRKKYINYCIALTVGLILYILLLQVAYITKFSVEEMKDHAGLNRYLPTFMVGILYFIIAMCIKNMEENKTRRINYCILVILIISFSYIQSVANVTITAGVNNIYTIEYTNNGRVPANQICDELKDNEEILVISQKEDTDLYSLMLRYYLYPYHKTTIYTSIKDVDKDLNKIQNIKDEIVENNIKYIYVFSTNSNLNEVLNNNENFKDRTLYKVDNTNNDLVFKEIPIDK